MPVVEVLDRDRIRWVPTAVARRMLGVSRQRVYQLVQCGRLAGARIDGVLLVSSASLEDRLKWLEDQAEMYGPEKGPRL